MHKPLCNQPDKKRDFISGIPNRSDLDAKVTVNIEPDNRSKAQLGVLSDTYWLLGLSPSLLEISAKRICGKALRRMLRKLSLIKADIRDRKSVV